MNKQNQGDSTICSYKKYKHDVERNLGEKSLKKIYKADGNKENLQCDIILDKI